MTPSKNDCIPEQFIFEQVKSCPVVVNFKGEPVTSDAGLTLIAELDRKREITSRLAACFKDYREPLFSGYLIVQILISPFFVYVVYSSYLLKCGMWDI
ncbi:MAG: transposase [Nostoc sp.]|uniref:transposase n=1 Tax=Nostoc sp. TaxID=1180 RepID=UPI002FF79CA9